MGKNKNNRNNKKEVVITEDNNYFNLLPDELVVHIFAFLDSQGISSISQICRRFFLIILNNPSIILYERFSKEVLSSLSSRKQLFLLLLESQNSDDLHQSILDMTQNMPNLLKNQKTMNQLSPLKLNGFFARQHNLIQKGNEIAIQDDSLRSNKKVWNVFLSVAAPMVIGYLSGSNTLLLIGFALGMTIFGYRIYNGVNEESQLINQDVANTSSLHRLFNLARDPTNFSYDEKTVAFVKKYP